ncbi:hypothetical protein J6590_028891 [Homalodisca vitripennis]|nr:hypothetical protein J6590_028891 [Homalodisca vitripennis]
MSHHTLAAARHTRHRHRSGAAAGRNRLRAAARARRNATLRDATVPGTAVTCPRTWETTGRDKRLPAHSFTDSLLPQHTSPEISGPFTTCRSPAIRSRVFVLCSLVHSLLYDSTSQLGFLFSPLVAALLDP